MLKEIKTYADLPEYGKFVLVYGVDEKQYGEKEFHVCEMNDLEDGEEFKQYGEFSWLTENGAEITSVTHWMELPAKPVQSVNILLIGGPGSGKGTLAKFLSSLEGSNAQHISTGDLFRYHIKNDTAIGQEVKGMINAGGLATDEISIQVMSEEIDRLLADGKNSFIFDGCPRNLEQGPMFDTALHERSLTLDLVFYLDTTDEILISRMQKRAQVEDRKEDLDEEYSKTRIATFKEKTVPLVEYYAEQGILFNVDASKTADEVNQYVLQIIKEISNDIYHTS